MNMAALIDHPEKNAIAQAILTTEHDAPAKELPTLHDASPLATPNDIVSDWLASGKEQLRMYCESEAEYYQWLTGLKKLKSDTKLSIQIAGDISHQTIYVRRKK